MIIVSRLLCRSYGESGSVSQSVPHLILMYHVFTTWVTKLCTLKIEKMIFFRYETARSIFCPYKPEKKSDVKVSYFEISSRNNGWMDEMKKVVTIHWSRDSRPVSGADDRSTLGNTISISRDPSSRKKPIRNIKINIARLIAQDITVFH